MEQRSPEWYAQRAGKFTASRFAALMAMTRSGPSTSRKNLIATLAVERITGTCMETFQNAAMQRGIDLEPIARAAYEDAYMVVVEEVAFIQHPRYAFVSCSPDGLVGDDGMVEFKCPSAQDKHLQALLTGSHTKEYKWQLQGQLWCAERQWVDAVSFDPRFPEGAQGATYRVERDDEAIEELEKACIKADCEVDEIVQELERKMKENI